MENKTHAPSKLVTTLKNLMPQKFVDTFCKAMQSTRWRGIQLSHLAMYGFEYEFPLAELGNDLGFSFFAGLSSSPVSLL